MDVKMSGADEYAIMQPRVDLPGFQNFLTTCRQPQDIIFAAQRRKVLAVTLLGNLRET